MFVFSLSPSLSIDSIPNSTWFGAKFHLVVYIFFTLAFVHGAMHHCLKYMFTNMDLVSVKQTSHQSIKPYTYKWFECFKNLMYTTCTLWTILLGFCKLFQRIERPNLWSVNAFHKTNWRRKKNQQLTCTPSLHNSTTTNSSQQWQNTNFLRNSIANAEIVLHVLLQLLTGNLSIYASISFPRTQCLFFFSRHLFPWHYFLFFVYTHFF